MKKFWFSLVTCGLGMHAWAQGQITFGNRFPLSGVDAPVFDTDCATRLAGPAYVAQAYVGFTPDSLRPVGSILPFRTGAAAGYVSATVVTVPGSDLNINVFFQMRAWETRAGASFEAAIAAGGKHGYSNIIPMVVDFPPGTPTEPIGLQSFCLVPEPSAMILGSLGGAALILAGAWRGRVFLPDGRTPERRYRC